MPREFISWFGIGLAFGFLMMFLASGCGEIERVPTDAGASDTMTLTPNGHQCVEHWQCQSGYCPASICIDKLANSSACHANGECASGFCHPVTAVCGNRPALRYVGESCAYDIECQYYCDDDTGKCGLVQASGTPCKEDGACYSTHCIAGRCI